MILFVQNASKHAKRNAAIGGCGKPSAIELARDAARHKTKRWGFTFEPIYNNIELNNVFMKNKTV